MWELPQIWISRTNSKIVGTHTFKKLFLIFFAPNSCYSIVLSKFEDFKIQKSGEKAHLKCSSKTILRLKFAPPAIAKIFCEKVIVPTIRLKKKIDFYSFKI
ncbi:hypothetical protein LIH_02955 [Leptospira interrogans serovar Hardjo-prajitno]|uniref:Uncharacterized protein n=1 Tax=Leptospira interrogans serovar Hardjo str. Norma TaxID=1279460 RepID=A0A0M3TKU7_LEPIR|nr:hypothetical protein LIL_10557 [Leptospira interrogans serovar Linhai str. 56609]ALE37941.1 hypothetical protein G436_0722 [Leptospira interrogans serovar Hardjo str. Norma]ALN99314.1 hypothetical protein LIH_02955 [Leptospira interrogans serovar Hardjo-prajitno]